MLSITKKNSSDTWSYKGMAIIGRTAFFILVNFFFFCEYECLPLCTYLGHIIYYFLNNFFLLVLNGILSLISPHPWDGEKWQKCVSLPFFLLYVVCYSLMPCIFFPHQRYFFALLFRQKFKSRVVLVSCFSFFFIIPLAAAKFFFLIFHFPFNS